MRQYRQQTTKHTLRLIAIELTRRCNLNCLHCRGGGADNQILSELTTQECERLLDNIASFAKPIIIFTGGEPLMRDDIFHLCKYGSSLGLPVVMATCGTLFTKEVCRRLMECGVKRVSFSIDGASAEKHDSLRGVKGAFEEVMRAIDVARNAGLTFQINTTVSQFNMNDLPAILELAITKEAVSFHPFLLVPTGKGKELSQYQLNPHQYERLLRWIFRQKTEKSIGIKPTCVPQYYRILQQQENNVNRNMSTNAAELDTMVKGCLGGQSFAFISCAATVQICGFLDISAGNLRDNDFNFKYIWDNSPFFNQIRDIDSYKGRCGYCEYRYYCGGCRARAFAMTGDYLMEEPFCIYTPKAERKGKNP